MQSSLPTIFVCSNNLVRDIIEGGEIFLVLSLWQGFCTILRHLQLKQIELSMLVSDLIAPLKKHYLDLFTLFLGYGCFIERTVFLYSSTVFQKVRKERKKTPRSNGKSQASFPDPLTCLVGTFCERKVPACFIPASSYLARRSTNAWSSESFNSWMPNNSLSSF